MTAGAARGPTAGDVCSVEEPPERRESGRLCSNCVVAAYKRFLCHTVAIVVRRSGKRTGVKGVFVGW